MNTIAQQPGLVDMQAPPSQVSATSQMMGQPGFGPAREPHPMELWWNFFIYNYLQAEFPNVVSQALPKNQTNVMPKNPNRCLFIFDLPSDVTEEELTDFFKSERLPAKDIHVVNINKLKNQATVEFPSEDMLDNIITSKHMSSLRGSFIQIKLFQIGKDRVEYPEAANLYFKDVDKEINQKDLHDYFTRFGNIASIKNSSNGYGYVQFQKVEDSEKCLAEHKTVSKEYLLSKIHQVNIKRFKSKAQRESIKDVLIEFQADKPRHEELKRALTKAVVALGVDEDDVYVKSESADRLVVTVKASNIVKANELLSRKEALSKELGAPIASMAIDNRVEIFKNKVYLRFLREDFNLENLKTYINENYGQIEDIRVTTVTPQLSNDASKEATPSSTPNSFGTFSFALIECQDSQHALKLVLELPGDKKFIKTFLSPDYDKRHYFVNIHFKKQDRMKFLKKNMSYKMSTRLTNLLSTAEGQQKLWEKFMEYMAAVSYTNFNQMIQTGMYQGYPYQGMPYQGEQAGFTRHAPGYQGQGKHHGEMGHSGYSSYHHSGNQGPNRFHNQGGYTRGGRGGYGHQGYAHQGYKRRDEPRLEWVHKEEEAPVPVPTTKQERRDMNWLYNNMESFKAMSPTEQEDVLREALEVKCISKGISLHVAARMFEGKGVVQVLTLLDNDEHFNEELQKQGLGTQ